jgi:hypothetical protein
VNSADAARIFASLQGAFPYAKVDDITVSVWANSLDLADYAIASEAVQRWIASEEFFPSIAAFNGAMTTIRREQRGEERPLVSANLGAIRCNGDGWFDRGDGMEPCPACNPWMRRRWSEGKLDQRARPPADFVMPEPCVPSHAGEGPIVTDRRRAMQMVIAGLREQLAENGLTPEQIDAAVKRQTPTVMAAVGAVPDSPHDDD